MPIIDVCDIFVESAWISLTNGSVNRENATTTKSALHFLHPTHRFSHLRKINNHNLFLVQIQVPKSQTTLNEKHLLHIAGIQTIFEIQSINSGFDLFAKRKY